MKFFVSLLLIDLVIVQQVAGQTFAESDLQDNIHELSVTDLPSFSPSQQAIVVAAESENEPSVPKSEVAVSDAPMEQNVEETKNSKDEVYQEEEKVTTLAATADVELTTEDPIKPISVDVNVATESVETALDADKVELTTARPHHEEQSLDYPNDAPQSSLTTAAKPVETHEVVESVMTTATPTAKEPFVPTMVDTSTAVPAVVHMLSTQKCFSCSSDVNASCVSHPTKQIDCQAGTGRNGCFALVKVDTNITTRGCISELANEGMIYCKKNSKLCHLCYDEPRCNSRSLPPVGGAGTLQAKYWPILLLGFGLVLNIFY